MGNLIGALAMLAIVGLGLAIMVGKVTPGDGLVRLGTFILILGTAPALVACFKVALVTLKPLFLVIAILLVVTVCVRVLLTMKS